MNLTLYQSVPYRDGGRVVSGDPETNGLDCFGLVRHALYHQFSGPLLESFNGIFRTDHAAMTSEFNAAVDQGAVANKKDTFELCSPCAGAIACCFHKTLQGDVFHHVGICVDELTVMHTSSNRGYAVVSVRAFKRLAGKVEFYRCVDGCDSNE